MCVCLLNDIRAESVLVSEIQQACGRSNPQRVHEGRALHPLSDVVPEGVFYLRWLADAHYDQLAVIKSHQHVRLFLSHRHTPDGHAHRHRRHAKSQAVMATRREGAMLGKNYKKHLYYAYTQS